jgi:hypothetical protein
MAGKRIHGKCSSPEYRAFQSMLSRCRNKNNPCYHNFGGVGISVWDRWDTQKGGSFENFYHDLGDRPSHKHLLGRLNQREDYTPENTKWMEQRYMGRSGWKKGTKRSPETRTKMSEAWGNKRKNKQSRNTVTLVLTPEENEQLTQIASQWGLSKAAFVRSAVQYMRTSATKECGI